MILGTAYVIFPIPVSSYLGIVLSNCCSCSVISVIIFSSMLLFPVKASTNRKLKYLSEAHFEFSIELYHQMAKSKPGNIVIAAQNVNVGLAMLFLGSTSNTTSSRELRQTLHYENMSYVDIHRSHRQVLQVLSDPYYSQQSYFSKVGLFVQKGAGVKQDYDRAVKEFQCCFFSY